MCCGTAYKHRIKWIKSQFIFRFKNYTLHPASPGIFFPVSAHFGAKANTCELQTTVLGSCSPHVSWGESEMFDYSALSSSTFQCVSTEAQLRGLQRDRLWGISYQSIFSSVQFSCSVVSNSLWPHGLQHTRLPCPSSTLGICSNSCPSSWWCHPTIFLPEGHTCLSSVSNLLSSLPYWFLLRVFS